MVGGRSGVGTRCLARVDLPGQRGGDVVGPSALAVLEVAIPGSGRGTGPGRGLDVGSLGLAAKVVQHGHVVQRDVA